MVIICLELNIKLNQVSSTVIVIYSDMSLSFG